MFLFALKHFPNRTQPLSFRPARAAESVSGAGRLAGRHDWDRAPAFLSSERGMDCFLPAKSRPPLRLGSASRGRAPSLPNGALERGGTRATRGLPLLRPAARAPHSRHPALPSSERRGLCYAMRRKRPVRAAVAREVSVATEMTSDPGGVSGGPRPAQPLLWKPRGRKPRCGCGPASDAARVCQPPAGVRACAPVRRRVQGLRESLVPAHRWPPSPGQHL